MTQPLTSIVTGAGTGVGRAVALALLKRGDRVLLAGRRKEPLEETAQLAEALAGEAVPFPTDVAEEADVAVLFDEGVKRWGRVDLLFNNAGIGAPAVPIEELDVDDWRRVVDINLTGMFLCIKHAFRVMKTQDPMGGRIVNNGSISSQTPRPNSMPYTATKHAVTGLTKSAALDGRNYDIACGQIDIGNAESPMTKRMKEGVPQANGTVAVEDVMSANDVADAVVYMSNLPLSANVLTMTVMATKIPLVGRG